MESLKTLHRLEFSEFELCKKLKCRYATIRSYLMGYKFSNVAKIKVWYYANPDNPKRKSLTYKYILSPNEYRELVKLRHRPHRNNRKVNYE